MANGKSKVALITGASSGMGKEMAKSLLKDGLTVVVAARSVEKMANLRELGAHPLRMDITDEASIQAAVNEILDTYGKVSPR
ncbi:SDR family NAD(P)-dependent oxidoreductase [Moorena sp. SIO3I6]|uniref:SDR family NAD(P)-dependent oxidoreductase n=1 Tax=Moorena sp. SIO3I6 TaxID=2607831 RepID=UPI0013F9B8E3|nr:SDR family NAD(P)-dependent oxidoreductase [Moorena sp. SIO3I6]NEP29058.1 SDR family NAD(P)-dependent oxidoreductase [Moorena sp. SIO3I6]